MMKTKTTLTLRMIVKTGFLFGTLLILIHNSVAENFGILEPSGEIIETGFDNRSIAMGKTTTITPRSSSAIFSNPAILATFSKPQIQLGGKLLYGMIMDEAARENKAYESYEAKYSPFPNRSYLALAVPYRLPHRHLPRLRDWQIVFEIGYQRNEGVAGEVQAVRSKETGPMLENQLVDARGRRRGALSTLTPGVSFNSQDKYFIGLTLNRTLGSIIYAGEWKHADYHKKIDEEQEQSALFFRIGALAKVTPELSVGVMYRPEFDWELGDTITRISENGEIETSRDQTYAKLTIPAMWGLGAEYKVSPEFVIALEVQSRPFSNLQWGGDVSQELFIDNSLNFAIGAEYSGVSFPLRFGAFRDAIPFVDENDTVPVSLVGLTGGIGSGEAAAFSWDASVLFGTWERVNNKGQKYSENLIRVGISATYRFRTDFGSSAIN